MSRQPIDSKSAYEADLKSIRDRLAGTCCQVFAQKSSKIYRGHIVGRNLDFAQVWFEGYDGQVTFDVSWQTLARAVDAGKPVLF